MADVEKIGFEAWESETVAFTNSQLKGRIERVEVVKGQPVVIVPK